MNIKNVISGFKLKCYRTLVMKERIAKLDLGILKVAFMVAALDGEVTDDEYEAFEALAKQCRGYTAENAAAALKEAMRSAGYLLLAGRRLTDAALVKEFIAEAKLALPEGFAYSSIEDVRRAIVTWITVGMCDGDYSRRERLCIEALRKQFAEIVIKQEEEMIERWQALSPAFVHAYGDKHRVSLVDNDFITRVEMLAGQLGDMKDAAKQLHRLVTAK